MRTTSSSEEDVAGALGGVSAIPVTPFTEEGSIDEAALRRTVGRMADSGVDVVIACGNTSEYVSLTADEARRVASVTIEAAGPALPIVGVGGPISDVVAETRWAVEHGAAGVMVHSPSGPYLSGPGLVDYYTAIAGATDAAVVLYVRDTQITAEVLEKVVPLANVVGIKYALPDVLSFATLAERFGDRIVPVCGLAESWAPFFWFAGGRGFTSGLANAAPEISVALRRSLEAGDVAKTQELWRLVKPFEALRARDSSAMNVSAVKEAMVLRGYLDNSTVRPPISSLSAAQRKELEAIVDSWGSAL